MNNFYIIIIPQIPLPRPLLPLALPLPLLLALPYESSLSMLLSILPICYSKASLFIISSPSSSELGYLTILLF